VALTVTRNRAAAVAAGQLVARLDGADLADEVRLREAELSAADAALRGNDPVVAMEGTWQDRFRTR